MNFLKSFINGELSLIKTFWLGLIGYVILNVIYLPASGIAHVYQENLDNEVMASLTTLQLARPAIILFVVAIALGLYTALAAAALWQAANRFPNNEWSFLNNLWVNFCFLAAIAASAFAAFEIIPGINIVVRTFSHLGGM